MRRGEQVYFACFACSILQCGKHYDLLVGAESAAKFPQSHWRMISVALRYGDNTKHSIIITSDNVTLCFAMVICRKRKDRPDRGSNPGQPYDMRGEESPTPTLFSSSHRSCSQVRLQGNQNIRSSMVPIQGNCVAQKQPQLNLRWA